MSDTVNQSHVSAFTAVIHDLAAQGDARIPGAVSIESGLTGEKAFFDRIGNTSLVQINDRHGDTPQVSVPHSRRMVVPTGFDTADLVDKLDLDKMLLNPVNSYSRKMAEALNRQKDDTIIAAFFSNTTASGQDGTTAVSWDTFEAANPQHEIVHGSAGLTVDKIADAKQALDQAEVPNEGRFFILNSQGLNDLLKDTGATRATSQDNATVKALVRGEIDTWLGFQFIRSERLETEDSGSTFKGIAFQREAVKFGIWEDLTVSVDRRADKRNSMQVYYRAVFGAVRMEEERIVQVQYQ